MFRNPKRSYFTPIDHMTRTIARLLSLCAIQLATISFCFAQNKPAQNTLQPPPAGITIDGDLKEWGDSLRYYNEDQKLYYTLANDKDNLYMAIRINDRSEQIRVFGAGLTLSIDTRGKKKETFSVTFPIGGAPDMAPAGENQPLDGGTQQKNDEQTDKMRANLTKLRQIKVTGFKDVESELITTSNTYGFKTAIDFDKDDNLIYEAAIPLKLFHDDEPAKNEWAFNFKINGLTKPGQKRAESDNGQQGGIGRGGMGGGMGGGRGGRGGGRGMRGGGGNTGSQSTDHSELSKSVDFWEKFYLAKQ